MFGPSVGISRERVVAVDLHPGDGRNVPSHAVPKDAGAQPVHLVDVVVVELLPCANPNRRMHGVLLTLVAGTQETVCISDKKNTYSPG
jgi:L-serine deaminase